MNTIPNNHTSLLRLGAEGVSLLLHPYGIALWMTLMIMCGWASPLDFPSNVQVYVVVNVVFMTILVPLVFGLLLRRVGKRVVDGGQRRRRLMQLGVLALCYGACGWMFDDIVVLFLVRKVMYTLSFVTLLTLCLEFYRSVSYRMVAMGALLAMMWMLLYVGNVALLVPFVLFVLGCGLSFSARLYLGGDSPYELIVGLLLGLVSALIIFVQI